MDQATINEVISFLKQSLINNGVDVNAIALFGSALSGTMQQGSDIDILIISKDFIGLDIFDRAIMTMKSERETIKAFKIPLDIISLSPEEYTNSGFKYFNTGRIVA